MILGGREQYSLLVGMMKNEGSSLGLGAQRDLSGDLFEESGLDTLDRVASVIGYRWEIE